MTFRRLLPIIIILAVVAGVVALIVGVSDAGGELISGSSSGSNVETLDYGEYSKDIIVDENTEVTGDLAEYVSVVPGTYKLNYESKDEGKYGSQEYVISIKIKLNKQYPHEVSSYQKLKFLTSRGTFGKLEMDISRGSLDFSEGEKFKKFVKEGNVGDEKEFMFYKSIGNREYADANYSEAHGLVLVTDGYEDTSSSNTSSSSTSSSSTSSSSNVSETTTSSSTESSASASSSSASSSASSYSDDSSTDESVEDDNNDEDFEEDYKIDLELDEYESYIEQYKECDDKKSAKALKLYSQAKAYGLKMKAKKSKMSKAQKSRLESISSQL